MDQVDVLPSNLKLAAAAVPLLLCLSITGSNAQNSDRARQSLSAMVGTLSVEAETEMSGDSLTGCHFFFHCCCSGFDLSPRSLHRGRGQCWRKESKQQLGHRP
jgi:hypothetical protein